MRYPYSFDRLAEIYDSTRALPEGASKAVTDALRPELLGRRVLEVGIGTGRIARPLQAAGIALIGTDVSRKMLQQGIPQGLRGVILADAHDLPFRDGSFDCTTTNHVLHLIENWKGALAEICRVTREWYFSVVEHESRSPDIDETYDRVVRETGDLQRRPGIHERRLRRGLEPDRVMAVGKFEGSHSGRIDIDRLRGRSYSGQWNIPEDVHQRALGAIESGIGDVTVHTSVEVEIIWWKIERLGAFVNDPNSMVPEARD